MPIICATTRCSWIFFSIDPTTDISSEFVIDGRGDLRGGGGQGAGTEAEDACLPPLEYLPDPEQE